MSFRRESVVAVGAGAGFLALAGLVVAGVLAGVDRYAVRNLMPWLEPSSSSRLIHLGGVFVPDSRPSVGGTIVAVSTYPASPFISALIVAGCAYAVARRGHLRAAAGFLALWVVANVIEVAAKVALEKPPVGVSGFRHSYPSGHTLRACIVAAVLAWTWRRIGLVAAVWALTVPFSLVALGDHTPTDVVGSVFLAVCLLAVWHARLSAELGTGSHAVEGKRPSSDDSTAGGRSQRSRSEGRPDSPST